MMRNLVFFTILFVLLFISNTISAQKNFKLEILASQKQDHAQISKLKTKKNFTSELQRKKEIDHALMKLYSQAYVLAQIDSNIKEANTLKVYISLNQKYKWKNLSTGNLNPIIIHNIGLNEGAFNDVEFDYHQLISIEETIIKHYENHGYPFASISLDSIKIENNEISAQFKMIEGPQFYIDTIILEAYDKIHKNYISQLIDIKTGDVYNESKIQRISKQLASMSFANETKPFQVIFNKDKASIHLFLAKQNTNIFDGVIGFQPKSSIDQKLVLTGNLRLKLINSFKRGETIDLNWRSPGNESQNIDLGFAYPYLFNTSIGIDYRFKLFKQDTSFINIRNVPGLLFLINAQDYIKLSADFFSSTTLTKTLINGIPHNNSILDMHSSLLMLEANLNKLDYKYNPRKGWWLNISGGYGSKKIIQQHDIEESFYDSIPLSSNQFKISAHLEYFIPLFKRQTIRLANKSELLDGDYLLSNELFRIGGFSDFRGFDEQSIYASSYSIFTVEWRLLLERNSYINVFWNGAYVENTSGNINTYDNPMGFGAGLSFETKAGIFALSYALGQQQGNPIEFSTAKIHFGYMARF